MPHPPRPVPRGFVERGSPAACGTATRSGKGCSPPQEGLTLPERGVDMPGLLQMPGSWQVVRAEFSPASEGMGFPLVGLCCSLPRLGRLGERSGACAPRFDLLCFNHPQQASPVHMQMLCKCQTVPPLCVWFNSFIFGGCCVLQESETTPLLGVGLLLICGYAFR